MLALYFDLSSYLLKLVIQIKKELFKADSHEIILFHTLKPQSPTTEKVITFAGSLLSAHAISLCTHVTHVKQLNTNFKKTK